MPSISEIIERYIDEPQKLLNTLCIDTIEDRNQAEYLEEYNNERTRRVKSVGMRQDKTYTVMDADGNPTKETKTIYVSRLVIPFPKKIVRTAAHFLFGGEMHISADENNDALSEFEDVWVKDLKMQSVLKRLARVCMTETKAALLFYPQQVKEGEEVKELKLRVQLLSAENGEFYPHFDDYGDMDAFIRVYKVKNIEGQEIQKGVIYTREMTHTLINESGSWSFGKGDKNRFGKIPAVYVEQKEPEWESVAALIDGYENRISRLADTNDYFGEPLLKLFGKAAKAPSKEEVGKIIEFEMTTDPDGKINHGDAEYATWDHSPESTKLELETEWDSIFSMTSTPDLSFNNVKGLGTASGVALRLMFMDAVIKREEKGEIFYDALNRCISVVTAGIAGYTNIKLEDLIEKNQIQVTFTDQLPSDMAEEINTLVTAAGGKPIISQETAAGLSPLTPDAQEEVARLKGEAGSNETFNM